MEPLMSSQDGDNISNPLEQILDQQAVLDGSLGNAKAELELLQRRCENIKEGTRKRKENQLAAEKELKRLQEEMKQILGKTKEKEEEEAELVEELVSVKWKIMTSSEQVESLEEKEMELMDLKVQREQEMKRIDDMDDLFDDETKRTLEKLSDQLDQLKSLKRKIEENDPEVVGVLDGSKLKEVEEAKQTIKQKFTHTDAFTDTIYVEMDEKQEALSRIKTALVIKERQHKARMRKIQRQLHELQETEKHLKRTAEYLGKQVTGGKNKLP